MEPCTTCGNRYDKAFRVTTHTGDEFVFDSYECAINRLAPICVTCGCRVIGHGVESAGSVFCCAHCARARADTDLKDRDDALAG